MPTTPPAIDVDPDIPSGIGVLAAAALQQEKSVPEEILQRIPAETVSVSNLVATDLPRCLQDVLRSPESCLSKQAPNWTAEQLWEARVPPRTWLDGLDIAVDRGWASGILSIEAPVSSRNLRFPLWIGNFWLEMAEVIEQREKWKRALGWMQTMVRSPEIQEAERLLERTPWGLRLWPLAGHNQSTRVGFLAGLLSNEWLAERHIDTLVSYLGDRFQKSNQPGATLVADQYLGSLLSRKRGETAARLRENRELRTYADKILGTHSERLLFPAHIGGSVSGHWIVFSVNTRERTISYGKPSRDQMTRYLLTRHSVVKATLSNLQS